jgi:palmitoyltransferase
LTEHEVWKNMLSNWEVAVELVTLLKELDAAIPKGTITVPPLAAGARETQHLPSADPAAVAVERPYDTSSSPNPSQSQPQSQSQAPDFISSPRPYLDETAEEPSDFEWRNLKKLAVLVLSSLVWKNRQVQDQVRPLGGIEAVLNCCSYDEHNPYIREHAIMCLRFLMEGNRENQDRIRALERVSKEAQEKSQSQQQGQEGKETAEGVEFGPPPPPEMEKQDVGSKDGKEKDAPKVNVSVPEEVLDQQGYETYMDAKGQVMLRKREARPAPPAVDPSRVDAFGDNDAETASSGKDKGKGKEVNRGVIEGVKDPKDLEALVQQVMKELPARAQGVRHDAEKAAALAKLDKNFGN